MREKRNIAKPVVFVAGMAKKRRENAYKKARHLAAQLGVIPHVKLVKESKQC